MLDLFSNLQKKDSSKIPNINMLLFGSYGVGKTVFALSFPGTVYLIDLENGSEMYGEVFDNVKVVKPQNFKELMKALEVLKGIVKEDDCVVLDSETVCWDLLQYTRASHANKAGIEGGALNLGDWGTIKRVNKNFQQGLINLNCAVIALAQEREMTDGDGVIRDISPKCEGSTPHYFDVVARLSNDDDGRKLEVGKRRGNVLNKDVYDISGKTFTDVFGEDFELNPSKEAKVRNYRIKIMYARSKKDLQDIADILKADESLKDADKNKIKEEIKKKAEKL